MGGQLFGASILHIEQIIRKQEIAPVPDSPPPTSHDGEGYVYGIVNLAGRIALLLDLKSVLPKEVFHI